MARTKLATMDRLERVKRAVEANGVVWTFELEVQLTAIAISLTSDFHELEMVQRLLAHVEEISD